MKRNVTIDTALLVTAATALLYTWSTASFNGFLAIMMLDPDIMERSFHQVIYSGLLISLAPVMLFWLYSWLILFFWSHYILPYYVIWTRNKFSRRRKMIKIRYFFYGKWNAAPVERRTKAFFTNFTISLLIALTYLVSLAYFESIGKNNAKSILSDHINGKNKISQMIQTKIDGKARALRFLACGARTCAGIEENTDLIFYFSATTSYSFIHHTYDVKAQTP
tara:strand:+ start:349 stop:1014 length:666 start_codon:yes stop_codon:yes gene_type:complete